MVDLDRLQAAYSKARTDLLADRGAQSHWTGELCSSPLSTATAVSALVLAEQHGRRIGEEYFTEAAYQGDLSELVLESLRWLAARQNEDGGWGDTDRSASNIATTMLVRAAFHLTCVPADCGDLLERADAYIDAEGGLAGLRRRYGRDKTFAAPILANCALAEVIPWRKVPQLPFELACLPQSLYRFLRLPVVSYAIPALVAIGQARYYHKKPLNPLTRLLRAAAVKRSLKVLERMQPESGGFLEATPLTSFVVMSLAGIGRGNHPVARRGVEFLFSSVRPDGSWPIDTNLATWNTSLSALALSAAGEDLNQLGCLDWLLACQHRCEHPFTAAAPGGWAWTDLSGGVPDADDTATTLLALAAWSKVATPPQRERIQRAARAGIKWLLELQNHDGGWPTFCRGWGRLHFDRSGSDLTANVLRALDAWHGRLEPATGVSPSAAADEEHCLAELENRIGVATDAGLNFLAQQQRPDGSWLPLWFGNQHSDDDSNPVFGTARVLLAYRDLNRMHSSEAQRALRWLAGAQQADGGWGGGPQAAERGFPAQVSTVEETALATEALLAAPADSALQSATEQGLNWLVEAVLADRHHQSAPIGFYFAKLWYYERLYPRILSVSALGHALARAKTPAALSTPTPIAQLSRT